MALLAFPELILRSAPIARALDGAVVLGPETLPQALGAAAADHRQRRESDDDDCRQDDDDPQPGGHGILLMSG
jgi:hypothetical protein